MCDGVGPAVAVPAGVARPADVWFLTMTDFPDFPDFSAGPKAPAITRALEGGGPFNGVRLRVPDTSHVLWVVQWPGTGALETYRSAETPDFGGRTPWVLGRYAFREDAETLVWEPTPPTTLGTWITDAALLVVNLGAYLGHRLRRHARHHAIRRIS